MDQSKDNLKLKIANNVPFIINKMNIPFINDNKLRHKRIEFFTWEYRKAYEDADVIVTLLEDENYETSKKSNNIFSRKAKHINDELMEFVYDIFKLRIFLKYLWSCITNKDNYRSRNHALDYTKDTYDPNNRILLLQELLLATKDKHMMQIVGMVDKLLKPVYWMIVILKMTLRIFIYLMIKIPVIF